MTDDLEAIAAGTISKNKMSRMTAMKILLVLLCGGLAGCGPRDEPVQPAGTSAAIPSIQAAVIEAQSVPVPLRVEVTGQVASVTQATLSSQIQAAVKEVRVREGSPVKKGETLVLLDDRDLRAELARAEAEADNAKAHLKRMRDLFTQDSVARQELENAERTFKVAEANRTSARTRVSYTVVAAPFDGLITEKLIHAGELASPGRPLLRLEDPRHLRLEATVAEGDLKSLSRGDLVPVVIDALGGQSLAGSVAQILPTGDPATHTVLVKVELPPTSGLKAGMFGRMQLDKGTGRTLVVPRTSVIERGDLAGVYVVGPDSLAHLRWVKLGRPVGDQVEVLSGLNQGERVLAQGTQGSDGARVEVAQSVAWPAP
ncbi:MAG TPA: efflux RND transporter periplasmic adaptor subunit [Nitrospiraceae bacterium]|nr:efflux RND transporter periplasmic adaptor subunit [Nitrospiraceae bacterium]